MRLKEKVRKSFALQGLKLQAINKAHRFMYSKLSQKDKDKVNDILTIQFKDAVLKIDVTKPKSE